MPDIEFRMARIAVSSREKRHHTRPSLNILPDEVLQQIAYYLSPEDVLVTAQYISKRMYALAAEPLMWRHHCRIGFKYWDSKHHIHEKLLGEVGDVDWKKLYIYRRMVDAETTLILNSIVHGQVNRIQKFKAVADFGYDAKDTLLRHCRTTEEAEDVLARRYYANSVLDHLHRSEALAEWSKLVNGESVSIERALGSFDLFVLHDQSGDLLEISELLDNLASWFRLEHPLFDQLSTRKKALATVSFLRTQNFTGLTLDSAYRDLQNNYIGIALQDQEHPALPLVSVAIYCAAAQRLGLDARCCGVPSHVHAMVFPPHNETLDGRELNVGEEAAEPMYLDPYRSDEEISVSSLHGLLAAWGVQPLNYGRYLTDTTTADLILRTSRNILATVHEFRGQGGNTDHTGHPTIRLHAKPFADVENAFYSALWANFIFGRRVPSSESHNQRHFIPLILERFERLYPMDSSLIEKYICPLFNSTSNAEHELYSALRVVRAADQTPKQLRRRDTAAAHDEVKYKVGQVFRHRRYGYMAVITGWDIECGMNLDWISHNGVDSLSRGRHQSFYHALVEDTSIRYVAEESIEVVESTMPASLTSLAGRFFKRWDEESHTFVSNIRDEYPDD